jgi:transposase
MVDGVVVDNGLMTFSARTATRQAVCPGCGTVSGRVHGGYRRRLADVAVSGHRAVIDLAVRLFICPAQMCDRRTFVEQVEGLTERFARRTASLHRTLEKIALALAGRPGARLAAHLSIPTSANSLLRLLRKLPDEPVGTAPRVLGVDDFAFKKGHVYGTIILDMETGERVDVLPDRTAETLTAWLRAHPGAEIVCRDRATAYAIRGCPHRLPERDPGRGSVPHLEEPLARRLNVTPQAAVQTQRLGDRGYPHSLTEQALLLSLDTAFRIGRGVPRHGEPVA